MGSSVRAHPFRSRLVGDEKVHCRASQYPWIQWRTVAIEFIQIPLRSGTTADGGFNRDPAANAQGFSCLLRFATLLTWQNHREQSNE